RSTGPASPGCADATLGSGMRPLRGRGLTNPEWVPFHSPESPLRRTLGTAGAPAQRDPFGVGVLPMPQSLCQIYVHLVFSTKLRQTFLIDPKVREEMFAYLVGSCAHHHCPSLIVGGTEDHVHILCRLGKTVSPADLVRDLKRASSLWIKEA